MMRFAVASGKGGTGKTTVSVALAGALCSRYRVVLVDADVEQPNADLFVDGASVGRTSEVRVPVPEVDVGICAGCGVCAKVCHFNAMAMVRGSVMIFEELCHSCGACSYVCPAGAITERQRVLGVIERRACAGFELIQGRLHIGMPMATPVIAQTIQSAGDDADVVVIDAPPGTACSMVEAVRAADFVLLVTEPTPFGLHDLQLAVQTLEHLSLPFGVLINRDGIGDDRVDRWCATEGIDVLLRIPDDRRVAEAYARGEGLLTVKPELAEPLRQLVSDCLKQEVGS